MSSLYLDQHVNIFSRIPSLTIVPTRWSWLDPKDSLYFHSLGGSASTSSSLIYTYTLYCCSTKFLLFFFFSFFLSYDVLFRYVHPVDVFCLYITIWIAVTVASIDLPWSTNDSTNFFASFYIFYFSSSSSYKIFRPDSINVIIFIYILYMYNIHIYFSHSHILYIYIYIYVLDVLYIFATVPHKIYN